MTDAMRGTLVINKSGPYVASMELKNERPISPGMSVKIETMFTKMTFAPGDGQPVLIREIDAMVRGRMFLLKRIDETTKIRFTDYRRVERR
jgi:hypothetical protein